jgi:uncharacterized protein YjbI with pentapeptide repeats
MAEKLHVRNEDLAHSQFLNANLSGARFEDVDLSGAILNNINLRGARLTAIDFGGTTFSCLNTGEGRPKLAAHFKDVELDDCLFEGGSFAGVRIVGALVDGMTIGGVLVSDMMKAYEAWGRAPRELGAAQHLP